MLAIEFGVCVTELPIGLSGALQTHHQLLLRWYGSVHLQMRCDPAAGNMTADGSTFKVTVGAPAGHRSYHHNTAASGTDSQCNNAQ